MDCDIYAVIDTNVIVSAMLSHKAGTATKEVMRLVDEGVIVPVYNKEIFDEYTEVLLRKKFNFSRSVVFDTLGTLLRSGISVERMHTTAFIPDPKDIVFYEVALSVEGSFLVTGNTRHFPVEPRVVTPAEMLQIIKG